MASLFLHWRIVLALVLGAGIIGATYLVSTHKSIATFAPKTAEAEDTTALLKQVASKDTDGDGLPDWEEALYGTDPNDKYSVKEGTTDQQAVAEGLVHPAYGAANADIADTLPGENPADNSLTGQFARAFFESYMESNGGQPPDEATQQALTKQLVEAFAANAKDLVASHYSLSSFTTDPSVTAAAYAKSVEAVFAQNDIAHGKGDVLALVQASVEGDSGAQKDLAALSNTYTRIAAGLSRVPVPPALSESHLSLMRALDVLGQASASAANVSKDPLAALAGISVYATAPKDFVTAIRTISDEIVRSDGTPAAGEPGYTLWLIASASTDI